MKAITAILLFWAASAFAERFDVNACPEPGVLDVINGYVVGCWVDEIPEPEPEPPQQGGIDPPQLDWSLGSAPGSPFYECGSPGTMFRSPSPTDTKHALEDVGTSGRSMCIQGFINTWPYYMQSGPVVVSGHDKEIRFNVPFPRGVVVRNAQRIQITGQVGGVTCEGSSHVSHNGNAVSGCSYQ